ncbi:MAG: GntR family transcriptional regulator, partial [Planctomycetales bacterium]|nr:GntR family transcriptional regulator [Planctomycetales bacterium]
RIGPSELKELGDQISQLLASEVDAHWSDQAVESDQRFHALITSNCGSRRLAQEIGRYEL